MGKSKSTKSVSGSTKKTFSPVIFLIVYAIISVSVFFKVYNDVFDHKISLGGDNAGYYILGSALASGQGYTNIHSIQKTKHNHFPPGYPFIIATASKIFSNKITFIKQVNGFFLFLSLVFLFLIIYKFTGNYHIPFITTLFLLYNYHLLSYSIIMMSEVSFLFFSTLSLWIFLKTDFTKPIFKNWMFFILLIVVSFSYHIRSTGLALFAGVLLFLIFKKNWKYLLAFFSGFIILALPWYIRGKSLGGNSYLNQLFQKNPYRPELGKMELVDWISRFWKNFERYTAREIPSGILNFVEVTSYKEAVVFKEWLIGIMVLIIIIYGLIRLKKYTNIIIFYLVGSFGILLLWPEVWFGTRFLLPLIPIITFLFINGIVELIMLILQSGFKVKNQSVVYIALVVLSLFTIKSYGKETHDTLQLRAKSQHRNNFKNYFEIANWCKTNTPDTSVISCRKGQLFYLYSNRYVAGYKYTLDQEELIEGLKEASVDYVVLEQLGYSSTGRYLLPAIRKYPEKFKIIKHIKDPDTYLMRFLPELGYWGEWENDKKNGYGKYTWDNGLVFEGQWKDNKKNGKGKYIYPNGEVLEGVWENDLLNGEAILKSKEGKLIEKSVYKNNIQVSISN